MCGFRGLSKITTPGKVPMKDQILIVEDDSIVREGMRLSLEVEGYLVHTAESGREALDTLAEKNIDLILSDIVMDELSGIDLLLKVKKKWPEIIVILITGYGSLDTVIQALRWGAYDYLLKPCSDEELKIRIKRGLERKHMGKIVKEKSRQDAVFEVVAGLADTLNNLLAGISGNHEIIRTFFSDNKDLELLQSFRNAANCINKSARIVDNLCTTVSLFGQTEMRSYDLHEAFLGVKMQFDLDRLDFQVPNKLPFIFGGDRLVNAFSNIIQNALDAVADDAKVKISASVDVSAEFVEIVVEDNGCGISQKNLPKVFLPFFSSKEGERVGLGLWMAYQIIAYFKGTIDLTSLPGLGTTVIIRLPIYR
jgi:signal transduction histidine kinase